MAPLDGEGRYACLFTASFHVGKELAMSKVVLACSEEVFRKRHPGGVRDGIREFH